MHFSLKLTHSCHVSSICLHPQAVAGRGLLSRYVLEDDEAAYLLRRLDDRGSEWPSPFPPEALGGPGKAARHLGNVPEWSQTAS